MDDLHLHQDPAPDLDGLVDRLATRRYRHEHADPDAARAAAQRRVAQVGERGRLIGVRSGSLEAGRRVGEVWLVTEGEERAVVDLTLDDVALAPAVRGLVADLARSEDAVRLTVTVSAGDPVAAAFVEGGGFALGSTQMQLELGPDLPREDPADGGVALVPMSPGTWEEWMTGKVASYAVERTQAGESPQRAREVSEQQHAELLPDGPATPHHVFFVAEVGGERVGTLWIGTARPAAFVYDVEIDAPHRRRGHGAATMRAAALWAHEQGSIALGLNVFGPNHGARALYDRLGFAVTEDFWGTRL